MIGTILMDLCKVYDCVPPGLNLLLEYLTSHKRRIKVNLSYSSWSDIIRGVPQGSLLMAVLFNVFINGLFIFIEKLEICNFVDDSTLFICGQDISDITET